LSPLPQERGVAQFRVGLGLRPQDDVVQLDRLIFMSEAILNRGLFLPGVELESAFVWITRSKKASALSTAPLLINFAEACPARKSAASA